MRAPGVDVIGAIEAMVREAGLNQRKPGKDADAADRLLIDRSVAAALAAPIDMMDSGIDSGLVDTIESRE